MEDISKESVLSKISRDLDIDPNKFINFINEESTKNL